MTEHLADRGRFRQGSMSAITSWYRSCGMLCLSRLMLSVRRVFPQLAGWWFLPLAGERPEGAGVPWSTSKGHTEAEKSEVRSSAYACRPACVADPERCDRGSFARRAGNARSQVVLVRPLPVAETRGTTPAITALPSWRGKSTRSGHRPRGRGTGPLPG